VVFENAHVRVWDFVVEPNTSKGWHRHELPYVIIPMTDGEVEIESAITGKVERPPAVAGETHMEGPGRNSQSKECGNERLPQYSYRN
jgi:hypothetical protein